MDESILYEGKLFLVSYLKDKNIDYKTNHPWRNCWEFIVLHSLRVEGYVNKILELENHDLTPDEVLNTRLAAILHDIGRVHKREGHALLGKDIIHNWLMENQSIFKRIKEPDKLLYLIERHSNKKDDDSDYCLKVLRDADVLDEIGVMSIFMASNWIERSNPYFFNLLSGRIESFEISFCENGMELLNTESAKRILEDKKEFINLCNNQLKDELYGTEMFGGVNIKDYFGGLEIDNTSILDSSIKIIGQRLKAQGYGAILLTGPSSCGKGEIAKELRNLLSIPKERHLSMGDILRSTIKKARENEKFRNRLATAYNISDKISIFEQAKNSRENVSKAEKHKRELNLYFKNSEEISQLDWLEFCVTEGLLVPDEWTINIINATFEDSKAYQNEIFILDGYPRTIKAAEELLKTFSKFSIPIIKVIHLSISKDEMINRALGRKRFDDKKDSLERRYQFYIENVQPSIDYLKARLGSSKITLIDAHQPVYNELNILDIEESIKQVTFDVIKSLGIPSYLMDMKQKS